MSAIDSSHTNRRGEADYSISTRDDWEDREEKTHTHAHTQSEQEKEGGEER